jgi:hypothetical protein
MKANIAREVAGLKQMTVKELRGRYLDVFGEATRSGNKDFLWKRIAWRVQPLAEGGLSERAIQRAKELARDVDIRLRPPAEADVPRLELTTDLTRTVRGRIHRAQDARMPTPGTILKRQYRGHVYQIEVLDNGIFYDGEVYQSLSAVAHAITGSHWNGFLFFGLAGPNKEQA